MTFKFMVLLVNKKLCPTNDKITVYEIR